MATDLGKLLKKLRVDHDELLVDMGRRIDKSASFISAIERGAKAPPVGFEEVVVQAYRLDHQQAKELQRAADQSRAAFTIAAQTPKAREVAGILARRMPALTDEELGDIFQILNRKEQQ